MVAFAVAACLHETGQKLLTPIILNYFGLNQLIMHKHAVAFCCKTTTEYKNWEEWSVIKSPEVSSVHEGVLGSGWISV